MPKRISVIRGTPSIAGTPVSVTKHEKAYIFATKSPSVVVAMGGGGGGGKRKKLSSAVRRSRRNKKEASAAEAVALDSDAAGQEAVALDSDAAGQEADADAGENYSAGDENDGDGDGGRDEGQSDDRALGSPRFAPCWYHSVSKAQHLFPQFKHIKRATKDGYGAGLYKKAVQIHCDGYRKVGFKAPVHFKCAV